MARYDRHAGDTKCSITFSEKRVKIHLKASLSSLASRRQIKNITITHAQRINGTEISKMANEVAHAPNKTWELSLYELHRTPQEAITDNTEIAVSPRSLHSELMCPICLDMLKSTMTTKECLHRFCQDCIITALRSGNKECPTCRKKLVSKRSLRPDPNFDALISKIYPSREEYEEHQERVLAKLSQHHNTAALRQSIEEGLLLEFLVYYEHDTGRSV